MSKRSQRRYLAASAFIVLCAATYGVLYATLSSGWEDAVVKWVRQNGGVANIRPGKPCRSCMRGAIATQNIPPAGIILRIPSQTLIRLFHFEHNAFAAVSHSQEVFWNFNLVNLILSNRRYSLSKAYPCRNTQKLWYTGCIVTSRSTRLMDLSLTAF